jgi:hypothetical protein
MLHFGLTGLNDRRVDNRPGGKSEHHRTGRSITWSHGDVKESATESRPPVQIGFQFVPVRVKRCGKSAPVSRVTGKAW